MKKRESPDFRSPEVGISGMSRTRAICPHASILVNISVRFAR